MKTLNTHSPDCDVNDQNPEGIKKPCNCGAATPPETPEPSWTVETIMLINRLTPEIKDKSSDPDWFLLRQRFEEMERQLTAATAQLEREKEQRIYYQDIVYSVCNSIDQLNGKKPPGNGIVCGCAANPQTELQQAVSKLTAQLKEARRLLIRSKKYLNRCQCAGSDGWKKICKLTEAIDAAMQKEKQ